MSRRLIDANDALRMIENSRTDNPFFNGKTTHVWEKAHDCAISCVIASPTIDAVEPPCKIGDLVWCIRYFHRKKQPKQGIVSDMYFTKDMKLHIVVKYVGRGEWGKKVFATYEEAQAAIEKRETV